MTDTAETTRETASPGPPPTTKAVGYRLPASTLAEDIRQQFRRANWPEQNETLVALHVERAVQEVRCGTPLTLDAHESKGAGYLLADLAAARQRVGTLQTQLDETRAGADRAQTVLAGLARPLPRGTVRALIATVVALTVIGVLALKALLASSFDELLYFRTYYEGLEQGDAAAQSAAHAERLVLYAASLLLGTKAAAVIGSGGQLSGRSKALLVSVALVFSACLGIMRLTTGFSWGAVAVSGIELAILLSFTVLLLAVAGILQEDTERHTAYERAHAIALVEEERVAREHAALATAQADYETRRQMVAQREDDVRRLPHAEEVARATVRAEALVTTLELISAAAAGTESLTSAPPSVCSEVRHDD